ncbi:MAG: hypothetical protein ABEJ86_05520 [Halococcoides sp.]
MPETVETDDRTDDERTENRHARETPDDADAADAERVDDHLEDIEDGCGCAEVWEHLSEERDSADDESVSDL